ncbi:ATP-binding cassette subfamily C member 8 [Tanacetum coccineum]
MAIETKKNATSGSTVIDENRGRDDLRHQPKKRGTSKDVVASLDQRVAGVETSMAELKEIKKEGLEGLVSGFSTMYEGRTLSTRAVDDFLWDMEQYLEGVNVVDDASKIMMATRYLKDTAALWWRSRYGDIERGTETIDTWAEFVADFKKQFYPKNTKNEAKSRLRWAKTELERRGVQDLSTAIAHAEALIDFSTRRESSKPKDRKVNQEKGRGEKNAQSKVDVARLNIKSL